MMAGRLAAILLAAMMLATAGSRADDSPDGLRDEAFQAAQWALATSAGSALAQVGARVAAGDGALARLVRERQDLVEVWRARDRKVLQLLARSDRDTTAEVRALRDELDGLARRIAAVDADLERSFPGFADLSNPKPLPIAELRRLLRPDEALLLFLVAEKETWVWGVSARETAWIRVELGKDDLAALVRSLRRTLDPNGPARAGESAFGEATESGATPFDRATAHDLYRRLIAPLAPALGDATHWMIVADGPLASLPFAALVTAPPEGDDADPVALAATPWLARDRALTTLPTVSSLKALRAFERRTESGEPFRGFGAPALTGRTAATRGVSAYFRGARADVDAVRALSPLPGTELELKRLAAALRSGEDALVLGERATETAVKTADLSRARVIAFATHGLVSGELSGLAEPALVFTPPTAATELDDGLLTASEAAELKLSADWVVLSACNTAAGDGSPGAEGLSGLARAFLYAGARAILVSHWPVRDDAAAELTTRAFALLAEDPSLGRAEALRRSMLELSARPDFAHPSAWAPFVVVGEGR